MTDTYSFNETFTITNARQIASKVGADLKRLQDFYFRPSDDAIAKYEAELAVLLKNDVVDHVTYGFKRNGLWTEASLRYTANGGVLTGGNDDPGRVPRRVDVSDCQFYSFLVKNSRWYGLSQSERTSIERDLPIERGSADEPSIEGGGIWVQDRAYSSAGRGVARSKIAR
jgi:hypothetical protein